MTREVVWTLVVRGMLILAGLLSSVVTARLLGPDGRGIFFYWSTVAGVAIQFGNFGLSSSNTYYLARGQASLSMLAANSLWISGLAGGLIGLLVLLVLGLEGHSLSNEWAYIWPTLVLIPTGLYFLFATNLLVAIGRVKEYNYFELAHRYLGLLLIISAAWAWKKPERLLVMLGVAAVVICALLQRKLHSIDGKSPPSLRLVRTGFSYAFRAYLATTLGFFALRMNTFLLDRVADKEVLGLWSIAAQMLDIVILVPSTVGLLLFPKILRSEEPFRLMITLLRNVAIILALVCGGAALVGQELIVLVYGERFEAAYPMLLWGLPGAYGLGLISIVSQYLAARGMPISLIWIWLVGLITAFVLGIFLISSRAGEGAMMAFSLAHLCILFMILGLAKVHQKDPVIVEPSSISNGTETREFLG